MDLAFPAAETGAVGTSSFEKGVAGVVFKDSVLERTVLQQLARADVHGAWSQSACCEPLSRSGATRSPGKGPRARCGHNPALSCVQALSGPLRGAQQ